MKNPKGFSFKKAKDLYKKNLLDYIVKGIKNRDFEMKVIGIQYVSYGKGILHPIIGFDSKWNNDIKKMKYANEYEFPSDCKQMLSFLVDYILRKQYYNSISKIMKSIKNEVEENYHINILLDEISFELEVKE